MNYTATQFSTAEDKAKFVKHFISFVKKGFPRSMFNKKFYQRLSNTFGHIAHYDQGGFYDTFFITTAGKVRFLNMTMNYPCYGSPEFTFCDAEREIQKQLRKDKVLEKWQAMELNERNLAEYSEYQRLKNKFENA